MCVRLRWVQKSNFMGPCLSETELISRFFNFNIPGQWTTQGIGDDCAIIQIGDRRLSITTDTVAGGTHFLPDANPYTIGQKSLAVNLSDLAASGAVPADIPARRRATDGSAPDIPDIVHSFLSILSFSPGSTQEMTADFLLLYSPFLEKKLTFCE